MEHKIHESVRGYNPQYSRFDLSHEHKTSFNIGMIIPALCEEALPGDIWSVNSEVMVRFAPMLAPLCIE